MSYKHTVMFEAIRGGAALALAAAFLGIPVAGHAQTTQPARTPTARNVSSQPPKHKQPQTLQTVSVLGSHIPGSELATSNPVITISPEQIKGTGNLTLGSVMSALPVIAGAGHSANQDYGGTTGAENVGLRGMGASRTLVLIDGQRAIGYGNSGPTADNFDFNSIPLAAISKIEVLTNGASAIYGSQAIGGAINIVLKHHFNGMQFSVNTGISSHGDAQQHGGSFTFGHIGSKGSIVGGVSYNKENPLFGYQRSSEREPLTIDRLSNGTARIVNGALGSPANSAMNAITVPPTLAAKFGCATGSTLTLRPSALLAGVSPTGAGDYECSTRGSGYNVQPDLNLVQAQKRTAIFLNGSYNVTNNVHAFLTVIHNKTDSSASIGLPAINSNSIAGVTISKDSYYNPFGVTFSEDSGNTFNETLPTPSLQFIHDRDTQSYIFGGLRGHVAFLNHRWQWDLEADYTHLSNINTESEVYMYSTLTQAMGPSFMNSDGTVQCGTPASPVALSTCTPIDLFNPNTPAAKAAMTKFSDALYNNVYVVNKVYRADTAGTVLDLPAGPLALALGVGYEKRHQGGSIPPPSDIINVLGQCAWNARCAGPAINDGYNQRYGYGELSIPLLKDAAPFIHSLGISIGDRYEKYSDFGSSNDWEVALAYRPTKRLLFRGTVSEVFRAPTLRDEDSSLRILEGGFNEDPCDFVSPNGNAMNPNAGNPACQFVPERGTFVDPVTSEGLPFVNPRSGADVVGFKLRPETGKSFDFGAVYSPVDGLTVNVDFWRIYLNDILTQASAESELNLCFEGDTQFCSLITRFSGGPQQGALKEIITTTANLGRLDVKGIDLGLHYTLPWQRFGTFMTSVNATYMQQFKSQSAPGTSSNVVSNGAGLLSVQGTPMQAACPGSYFSECFMPRIKALGSVQWVDGAWSAYWQLRFLGRFGISSITGGRVPGHQVGIDQYGSTTYNNVSVGYDIRRIKTEVNVGMNNVFDRRPPLLFANQVGPFNTDTADFDAIGRYFWARATVTF